MRGGGVLLRAALRRALEALLGPGATHDLVTLAEAKPSLLQAQGVPEVLKALVDALDLVLYGRIEPFGQPLPELLALFRQLLDLGVDLVRSHDA